MYCRGIILKTNFNNFHSTQELNSKSKISEDPIRISFSYASSFPTIIFYLCVWHPHIHNYGRCRAYAMMSRGWKAELLGDSADVPVWSCSGVQQIDNTQAGRTYNSGTRIFRIQKDKNENITSPKTLCCAENN